MKQLALLALIPLTLATIHFQEEFNDESWTSRWVVSDWNKDKQGPWENTAGKWYGDESNKGIQTSEDYRFYAVSTKFPKVETEGKDLVVSFTLKFEQQIDCGGGYIKILGPDFDQSTWGGDTPYVMMFGPDICGATRKTHLILNYNGENHDRKETIRVESDQHTHQYTVHFKSDLTYEVIIDQRSTATGKLEEDWMLLPPKMIKDPEAKKPEDWVDEAKIPDPTDVKPEGWEDIPQYIADPEATKPEDWSDEDDGEWEAPLVENPEYKGVWKPKQIDNPDYKGPWVHPTVPNPEYKQDTNLNHFTIGGVGIEIWQVKSGTMYDSILISDSIEEANAFSDRTWKADFEKEKEMKEKIDEEERAKNPPPEYDEDEFADPEGDFVEGDYPEDEGYDLKEDL